MSEDAKGHVVIMGCGRVGSLLSQQLQSDGYSIAVIDKDRKSFRRLPPDFTGRAVEGYGFDRHRLEEAGIREASAFASVSSGDNSNIVSSRVAREYYRIDAVAARIYDPRRAAIYQRLGISTVASVQWTVNQIRSRLLRDQPAWEDWREPSEHVSLIQLQVPAAWAGRTVAEIEQDSVARVASLTRRGDATIPTQQTVLQEGDALHVMVDTARAPAYRDRVIEGREGA